MFGRKSQGHSSGYTTGEKLGGMYGMVTGGFWMGAFAIQTAAVAIASGGLLPIIGAVALGAAATYFGVMVGGAIGRFCGKHVGAVVGAVLSPVTGLFKRKNSHCAEHHAQGQPQFINGERVGPDGQPMAVAPTIPQEVKRQVDEAVGEERFEHAEKLKELLQAPQSMDRPRTHQSYHPQMGGSHVQRLENEAATKEKGGLAQLGS